MGNQELFVTAIKSNGGSVRHLVPQANQWEIAICGTWPKGSTGTWNIVQDEPTCKCCIARCNRMRPMKKLEGFICCHFDSRGGSLFIKVDKLSTATQKEAMKRYIKFLWGTEEDDKYTKMIMDQDLICQAILYLPDDYQIENGEDLEYNGRVISRGIKTLYNWPKWDEQTTGQDDIPGDINYPAEIIEFVDKNNKPQLLTHWDWPCWNDDAFNFIVVLD